METIDKARMKFSVICTVFNEAHTIVSLLDSLAEQTLLPAEIVIADADSTDKTTSLIEEWKQKHNIPLQLIRLPGANRSIGRNKAIEKATHDYLAIIDAGCTADKYWLRELAHGFKAGVEAVAGFYRTSPQGMWQEIFSLYLAVQPDSFNADTYLPSSRSLALTKAAWKKAGKYPEHLNTCEDLVFAKNLKEKTHMTATDKAWVWWMLPKTMGQFFHTVAGYAEGDVRARYKPHLRKILLVYARYVVFVVFPWLYLFYLLYPQLKFIRYLQMPALVMVSAVQIVADMAVMYGSLRGLFKQR